MRQRISEPKNESLKDRIKKAGKPIADATVAPKVTEEAGLYEVIHGRICFGYEDGEPVFANQGAIVELTAEEATRMLEDKTVRKALAS